MQFYLKLADKVIALHTQYDYVRQYCQDYVVSDGKPDVVIEITQQDINAEKAMDLIGGSDEYLETLAVLRRISSWLPSQNRLLCHGATIQYATQGGFLFTAPSGTGKSTHIRLWEEYLGNKVQVINGDKPFLAVEDGQVFVYGTPWAGKEGWQNNVKAPLCGICFLRRGLSNQIRRLEPMEALDMFMQQIYFSQNETEVGRTLELMGDILQSIPSYLLSCDISEDAVKCSFEMMTGLQYRRES